MKMLVTASIVTAALALSACKPEPVDPLKVEPATLETESQQHSYALGSNVGSFFQKNIEEQSKLGIEVDQELMVKGFIAALQGQSQLEEAKVQEYMKAAEAKFRAASTAKAEESALSNVTEGKAYLEENAKKEGVTVTESGLQYEVLSAGEGMTPGSTDTVKVHYKGTLLDGTEFDSSYSRGEPAVFPLNRVIPGWTEGLQLMKPGAKYKFHIPSELAYGKRATGKITPNSTLVFDVELLEIVNIDAPEEAAVE